MRRVVFFTLVMVLVAGAILAAPTIRARAYSGSGCAQFYTVRYGDNLFRIATYFGTTYTYLQQLNGLVNPNYIYAGQTLCVQASQYVPPPPPQPRYYVVQWGDSLSRIAARYGVSMWYLAQYNGIWNPNCIYAGQVIWIP